MSAIRQPIITILGHVDSGKTSLLDSIRNTKVMEHEAGGITQHIGATEVPLETIEQVAGTLLQKFGFSLKIPGLLFIDTPGHEAFSNLRKRGGSIADLAVVTVDLKDGVKPQTIEAIEILKAYKTPFVVALTKIDLIQGWQSKEGSFLTNEKNQPDWIQLSLNNRLYEVVGKLFEMGFSSERFDRVTDFTKTIAIIPVCSKSKEGFPELLALLSGLSQKFLENKLKLESSGQAKGTILEVKDEKGLGKTMDVILYDGKLSVGQEIVFGSLTGPQKTKIRALLEPKPLNEIRDPHERFNNVKEVVAATGVKIAAPNLDEALAGSPILSVVDGTESEQIAAEIESVKIESDSIGPIVKCDTLGSLEAFCKLLEKTGVKPKRADVGEVTKRDVLEAAAIRDKDQYKGVIFAFNVNIQDIAKTDIENKKIKLFEGKVVYHLIEQYESWVKELTEAEKRKVLEGVILPAKFRVLPNTVFRNTKPAVVGVRVELGTIKAGLKVFNHKENLGQIGQIQNSGQKLDELKKDEEAAVSITDATVGRNLNEGDEVYVYLPEEQFGNYAQWKVFLTQAEINLIEETREWQRKLK